MQAPPSPHAILTRNLLVLSSFLLAISPGCAPRQPAARSAAAAAPKTATQKIRATAKTDGTEELSERALKSLVVISHYGRDGQADGVGTGFIIDADGLIATSLHVIGEARPISVHLASGERHDVLEVHAWDRKSDLALLRIDAKGLPALPLGDSDTLKPGASVLALGNPQGLERSVVKGVVSARREIEGAEMIQIAIPIEQGNSGGPLIDLDGRVHGVLTLKSAVTANLGFAVPVNALKPLLAKPNPVPMARWLTIGALNEREWTVSHGARWTQRSGRIKVEGFGQGFGGRSLCLSKQTVPKPPYELAVTVKLDDESGAAGLIFGADGGERHFGFYPSAGQLRLTRFDGPDVFSWQVLEQVSCKAYHPGDWNTLKVRVEKDRLLCYVNDELAVESDYHRLAGAQVGLAKFRDTHAEFKIFQVGKQVGREAIPGELAASLAKQIDGLASESSPALTAALQQH
ncbi:MAG TPA: trypsin-like peptidase domain-containing protein, partial [Verrucomicrobiae bacterium]